MISLSKLSAVISERKANELLTLAIAPTSQAIVGQLATRAHMAIEGLLLEDCFDVFRCRDDDSRNRVVIPSPFAIAVFPEVLPVRDEQALRMLDDALSAHFMSEQPVLAVSPNGLGAFGRFASSTNFSLIDLSAEDLVEILLHRPPRDALLRRVIPATSLKLLNPYKYKGPIRGNMFVGREDQLARLTKLEDSYALVGPRAMGKTSLIYRAYDEIRKNGEAAIRVEFSTAMSEGDLLSQIVERLIEAELVWPGYRLRAKNLDRVSWLLEDVATRSAKQRIAIFIDEADEIETRCPQFVSRLRRLHNQDRARYVFVGYKQLRKAVYDAQQSQLMNVLTWMPLFRMSLRECGSLIFRPMLELGIEFDDPPAIQEWIYRLSGGAPSRVQMFCRAIIDELSDTQRRIVTVEDAERVVHIPWVHQELVTRYRVSTTPLEKIIAGYAALELPSYLSDFLGKARQAFPELAPQDIESEVYDLVTADVLDINKQDLLAFSFPTAYELARPRGDSRTALGELRSQLRAWLHNRRGGRS